MSFTSVFVLHLKGGSSAYKQNPPLVAPRQPLFLRIYSIRMVLPREKNIKLWIYLKIYLKFEPTISKPIFAIMIKDLAANVTW